MPELYDGAWRLFDWDASTGRTTWVLHDGDQTTFRVDTPVDAILDANQSDATETMGKRFGEWNRAASIPLSLYHSSGFAEASSQGDAQWTAKFLNDADNRKLRTSRGRV